MGTDIGASIRNPAHYCGVFGHKPTYGIVPWEGTQLPDSYQPSDLSVVGPMARSAHDLQVALEVITAPTYADEGGWRLALPRSNKTNLDQFRIATLLEHPDCKQDSLLTDTLLHAIDRLKQAGARIDENVGPKIDLTRAHRNYLLTLRAATGARLSDRLYADYCKQAAQLQETDASYNAYVVRAAAISHRDWWNLQNERHQMMLAWERFFQRYDVLLTPCAASTAFDHDQEGERANRRIPINNGLEPVTDQLAWAGLATLPKLPATAMPAGFTAQGLPCGLQVISSMYRDFDCIRFAELASPVLGGFMRPPL